MSGPGQRTTFACLYCVKDILKVPEPTTVFSDRSLTCVKCKGSVHIKCLRGSPSSALSRDYLFDMTCAKCSGEETYKRPRKLGWLYVVILMLYHLQSSQEGKHGFFHWKQHIYSLLLQHLSAFFSTSKKKQQTLAGTVAGVLSSHNGSVFLSGSSLLGELGWWKLIVLEPPLLTTVYKKPEQPLLTFAPSTISTVSRASSGRHRKRKVIPDDFVSNFNSPAGKKKNTTSQSPSVGISDTPLLPMEAIDIDCDINVDVVDLELPPHVQEPLPDLQELYSCLPTVVKTMSLTGLETADGIRTEQTTKPGTGEDNSTGNDLAESCTASNKEGPIADGDSQNSTSSLQHVDGGGLSDEDARDDEEEGDNDGEIAQEEIRSKSPVEPEVHRYRRMSLFEEADILADLDQLVKNGVKLDHKGAMLRRKLHVRKIKRYSGMKLFELSHYLPGSSVIAAEKTVTCVQPVFSSTGLAAPLLERRAAYLILDRYQTSPDIKSYDRYIPFIKRLQGTTEDSQKSVKSLYTSRVLKPYVWRDYETKPPKLQLLEQIRAYHTRGDTSVVPEKTSIDYCYVRAEHIPVINRICHQSFWPGIDLSESLQYSDFSCVALYKKLIIGFAFMVPDVKHDEAYVSFIFTHHDWRGAGIAKFMIYHLIQGGFIGASFPLVQIYFNKAVMPSG